MVTDETPSSVLFSLLKELKITNKDAAFALLTDTYSFGGKIPRERIEERTYLHRLVHAKPGDFPETYFTDLSSDALLFVSKAVSNAPQMHSAADLIDYLGGDHSLLMAKVLTEYGQNGSLFLNVISKIRAMEDLSDSDRATMMMLAYLAAGCYGDVARAVELVEEFQPTLTARGFRTELASAMPEITRSSHKESDKPSQLKLGLVRVIDGALDLGSVYTLDEGVEGTIIGSMATDSSSITDVGSLVSRRHLRVFRDEEGVWYAQGLGSTNGTTLIRGSDKLKVTVELPKAERTVESIPVPLLPGDALCLADTTVFLAMVVH